MILIELNKGERARRFAPNHPGHRPDLAPDALPFSRPVRPSGSARGVSLSRESGKAGAGAGPGRGTGWRRR